MMDDENILIFYFFLIMKFRELDVIYCNNKGVEIMSDSKIGSTIMKLI